MASTEGHVYSPNVQFLEIVQVANGIGDGARQLIGGEVSTKHEYTKHEYINSK
jgi:hypothetical protein